MDPFDNFALATTKRFKPLILESTPDMEAFENRVLDDLWLAITKEYPDEPVTPDELEIEMSYHEAFVQRCSELFTAGRAYWNK